MPPRLVEFILHFEDLLDNNEWDKLSEEANKYLTYKEIKELNRYLKEAGIE